ncbi:MAG: carbonic anhydrase family protein, partial [Polynucleobacter sp.]|nr:carbonic anhydrase family protein [Polynucleobacter sp.]
VGPSNWGSLEKEFATCKVGQMQAPIDILTKAAAPASAPIAAKYKASAGEIINNGHTIQVTLPDGGSAILSGTDYKLLQFHFHTPAEEGKVALKSNFDTSSMLPSSLAYYSYAGSLTTSPCSEGVSFYILKAPVELSKNQLNAFQKVFKMNARPLQPLNGRKITQSS